MQPHISREQNKTKLFSIISRFELDRFDLVDEFLSFEKLNSDEITGR